MNTKTAESIKQRYEELQPANGRDNTPRIGYYLIRNVFQSENYGIYQAKCCWKELESDLFNLNVEFTIQLLSLRESSQNPNTFNSEALRGQVIYVNATYDDLILWKGKECPIVRCRWSQMNFADFFSPMPSLSEILDNVSIQELNEAFDDSIGVYIDFENDLIEGAHLAPDQGMFPDEGDTADDIFPDEGGPHDDNDLDYDQDDTSHPNSGK